MPDNLPKISQEIKDIGNSARKATTELDALQKKIEGIIATQAALSGGTRVPTTAGIQNAAQRVVAAGEVPDRTGIGGGAQVRFGTIGAEITQSMQDYLALQAFNLKKEIVSQPVRTASLGDVLATVDNEEGRALVARLQGMYKGIAEQANSQPINITPTQLTPGNPTPMDTTKHDATTVKEGLVTTAEALNRQNKYVENQEKIYDKGMAQNKADELAAEKVLQFKNQQLAIQERTYDRGMAQNKADELTAEKTLQLAQQKAKVYTEADILGIQGNNNPKTGQNALNKLQEAGFKASDVTNITQFPHEGITKVTAATEDLNGVTKKGIVTVNSMGEAVYSVNRRFQSFGESIVRNTTEVLKWSLSVGIVFTTYQKFQQLITDAISNEAKLADVQVVLGKNQLSLNTIFNSANVIAKETGESVDSVITSYKDAYQAVGAITDPTLRLAAANDLLYQATVLSKLSTMDHTTAIDSLAGAMRQLQGPTKKAEEAFTIGSTLLDQWQTVANNANVTMDTLATSFSIVAESATNAGLSTKELTGIIALLSEKTGLQGKEAGNSIKAIIGEIYNDKTAGVLNKYGIAVKDVNGEMRSFYDISKEVSNLYKAGIISQSQLNEIANAWGGGVRRGQQVAAYLTDLARVQQLVTIQDNSSGASQEALAKKMGTVQTAVTNLGNSFQSLSMSIGVQGGFLSIIKTGVTVLDSFVQVLDKLTQSLGSLTIPATLMTAVFAIAQLQNMANPGSGSSRISQFMSGLTLSSASLLNNLSPGLGTASKSSSMLDMISPPNNKTSTQETTGFAKGMGAGVVGGLMGLAPGISQIGAGHPVAGAADIGAGIAGGIIGNMVMPGVGALIGGNIATGLVEAINTNLLKSKGDTSSIFVDIIQQAMDKVKPKELTKEEAAKNGPGTLANQQNVEKLAREFIGPTGGLQSILTNLSGGYRSPEGLSQGLYARGYRGENAQGVGTDTVNLAIAQAKTLVTEDDKRIASGEKLNVVAKIRYDLAKKLIDLLDQENKANFQEIPLEQTKFTKDVNDLAGRLKSQGIQTTTDQIKGLNDKLVEGTVAGKAYTDQYSAAQGTYSTITRLFTAMGMSITDTTKNYQKYADLILESSPDQVAYLNQLVGSYADLEQAQEAFAKAPNAPDIAVGGFTGVNAGNIQDKLNQTRDLISATTKGMELDIARSFTMPSIMKFDINDADTQKVIALSKQMRDKQAQEILTISEATKQKARDEAGEAIVEVWLGGNEYALRKMKGIPLDTYQQALDQLVKTGEIKQQAPDTTAPGLGITDFSSLTKAQFGQAMTGYQPLAAAFAALGVKLDPQPTVGVFKDGLEKLDGDQKYDLKIVQYLLSQIQDNTKKQLDGMFNFPAGASFWIPLQAAKMYPQGGGGFSLADLLSGLPNAIQQGIQMTMVPGGNLTESNSKVLAAERDRLTEKIYAKVTEPVTDTSGVNKMTTGTYYPGSSVNVDPNAPSVVPGNGVNAPRQSGTYYPGSSGLATIPTIPPETPAPSGLLSNLNKFFSMFGIGNWGNGGGFGVGVGPTIGSEVPKTTTGIEKINAINFKLDINSTTTLMVDGRTLATIVEQYLRDDLLRAEAGSVSVTATI